MTPVRRAAARGALVLAVFSGLAASPGSSLAGDIYRSEEDGVISFTNTHKKGKLYARVPSPPSRTAGSDTVAVGSTRYDEYIRAAATLYQLPDPFVRAVIRVESGFDPRAISRTNARGLMQLMPETAERMMVTDVFDPRQNIYGGVRYLRILANLFNGDIELTLAGYNAGENAVIHYGGIPPYEETKAYVVKVMEYYRYYRESAASVAPR